MRLGPRDAAWSAEGERRQPWIDAGEALLGVGVGVAGGGAEGRRGGEGTLGVLGARRSLPAAQSCSVRHPQSSSDCGVDADAGRDAGTSRIST